MISFHTNSPEETFSLAEKIGRRLQGGEVIGLDGELGAGKTVFVKGLAKGLDICEPVVSPTFNIVKEYCGRARLSHFDVYRIIEPEEMFEVGFDETLQGDSVTVVEWARQIEQLLPENAARIEISYEDDTSRKITIRNERTIHLKAAED